MDNKNKYLVIQLYNGHIIYSVVISGYLAAISKICKCAEINFFDVTVEYLDILQLNITLKSYFLQN